MDRRPVTRPATTTAPFMVKRHPGGDWSPSPLGHCCLFSSMPRHTDPPTPCRGPTRGAGLPSRPCGIHMTRFVLIRHAELDAAAKGRCYGSLDIDLSPAGEAQAQRLAHALAASRARAHRRRLQPAAPRPQDGRADRVGARAHRHGRQLSLRTRLRAARREELRRDRGGVAGALRALDDRPDNSGVSGRRELP